MDKERRKKKRGEVTTSTATTCATAGASAAATSSNHYGNGSGNIGHHRNDTDTQSDYSKDVGQATFHKSAVSNAAADDLANKKRQKNINSNSSIHTEIRTDDFVVRLLLSLFSIFDHSSNLLPPPLISLYISLSVCSFFHLRQTWYAKIYIFMCTQYAKLGHCILPFLKCIAEIYSKKKKEKNICRSLLFVNRSGRHQK